MKTLLKRDLSQLCFVALFFFTRCDCWRSKTTPKVVPPKGEKVIPAGEDKDKQKKDPVTGPIVDTHADDVQKSNGGSKDFSTHHDVKEVLRDKYEQKKEGLTQHHKQMDEEGEWTYEKKKKLWDDTYKEVKSTLEKEKKNLEKHKTQLDQVLKNKRESYQLAQGEYSKLEKEIQETKQAWNNQWTPGWLDSKLKNKLDGLVERQKEQEQEKKKKKKKEEEAKMEFDCSEQALKDLQQLLKDLEQEYNDGLAKLDQELEKILQIT